VDDIPGSYSLDAPSNIRVPGVRGSSGIGIGRALPFDHGDLFNVPDSPCLDPDAAITEWHQLLEDVGRDIREEQAALGKQLSDSIAGIFGSYRALLADRSLVERVESEI